MAFFDDPLPGPDTWEEPAPEPWEGPPANELGASVPIRVILARTERVLVAVVDVTAYSTGFELQVTMRRFASDAEDECLDWWEAGGPDAFRFGIQYADGTKVTDRSGWERPPRGPVLLGRGGGGGGDRYEQGYWAWPLPPPGPMELVCQWPAEQIALTRTEVDAAVILAAARMSEPLWDASRAARARGGAWASTFAVQHAVKKGDDE
ncbi:MAG TPA: hypothetical protein VE777_05535 [Gaiellales bacterium]|nr:hypothetical protein [Gaiellales bacterium]